MAAVGNWTFRGTSLYTGNVKITEIGGFTALPPLRGDDFLTMGRTGRLFVPKIHDEKHITLKIELLDVTLNSVQALLDQYATLFSNRAQGTLVYTDYNSVTRSAQAEVVSWTPVHGPMAKIWTGIVDFLLADPWLYGAQATTTVTPVAGLAFGKPVINNILGTSRTTWTAAMTGVTSGQPLIVCHATQNYTTGLTSIADNFSTPYTYVKVDQNNTYQDTEMWIGTGGVGTSGTVTVTAASGLIGGMVVPMTGASVGAGLAAIDVHGNGSGLVVNGLPTLSLTPTASVNGAIFLNVCSWPYYSNASGANATFNVSCTSDPGAGNVGEYLYPTSGNPLAPTWGVSGYSNWDIVGAIVKGSGAATTLNITNIGTVRAEKLTVDFLGPIVNPSIVNYGVGFTVYTSVAAAQHLIVDTGAFTALNNGVNVIGSLLHGASVPFLYAEPGANAMQVSGAGCTAATRCTVSFYPPFE